MKKLLTLLLCLPFFFLSPTTPASAIAFTANEYWFFVSEPTTIKYDDMQFTVINNQEEPIHVVSGYEQVEGFNVSVFFDWQEMDIEPGKMMINHYWFTVNSTLKITHVLYIMVSHRPTANNESQLAVGGGVVNKITYYAEEEGSLLDLEIVDQSYKRRNSTVIIRYKFNDSYSWAPIKEFEGFQYVGYLPNGKYLVEAYDLETGIYAKKIFELRSNTNIRVILKLVGFDRFIVITEPQLGLNCTIENYVGDLTDVNIYAELYRDGELYDITAKDYHSVFHKTTDFVRVLWFRPQIYEPGTYSIRAVIDSHGVMVAERMMDVGTISYQTSNSRTSDVTDGSNNSDVGWIFPLLFILAAAIFLYRRHRSSINNRS